MVSHLISFQIATGRPLRERRRHQQSLGNQRYRALIDKNRAAYQSAARNGEKGKIAQRVVDATTVVLGRFLKKGDDGRWHEVSDKEALWVEEGEQCPEREEELELYEEE